MRQIVKEITDRFLSKLPAGQGYFTLTDLAQYDFPGFFLERLALELNRKFNDSFEIPENEWIDTKSSKFKKAFEDFVVSVNSEVTLPSSYAAEIFEVCVNEIVNLLVQPRVYVPELLFGMDDEATEEQIEENSKWLVVYRHFANALTRYMFKRNVDHLSKEKGTILIAQIDDKLTQNYTSLNWVQLLEPWFTLMGNEIDSGLLRQFFEEKGKGVWAKNFEKEKRLFKRNEIIEMLSEPEVDEEDEIDIVTESSGAEHEMVVEQEHIEEPSVEEQNNESEPEPSDDIEEEQAGKKSIVETEEEDKEPIWKQFTSEEDGEDNLIGQFAKQNQEKSEPSLADVLAPGTTENKETDSDDTEEEDLEAEDEGLKKLYKYVNNQSDYFVQELFGGDDNSFIQALEDIASFDDWENASKYIVKDVFKRNMINIYSEPALDFTDTLQNYFLEKSKSENR